MLDVEIYFGNKLRLMEKEILTLRIIINKNIIRKK